MLGLAEVVEVKIDLDKVGELKIETVDYIMSVRNKKGKFFRSIKWKLTGLTTVPKEVSLEYLNELLLNHKSDIVAATHIDEVVEI